MSDYININSILIQRTFILNCTSLHNQELELVQQDRFELPMFTLWDQIYSLVLDHHPSSCCIICLIYTCNRTICYMQILETMKQDVIDSMVGHIGAAPIPSCSQNRCASNPHSCPMLTKYYVKSISYGPLAWTRTRNRGL